MNIFQFFLLFLNGEIQIILQTFGCIQLNINRFLIVHDLRDLCIEFRSFIPQIIKLLSEASDPGWWLICIHLRRILYDICFLQFCTDCIGLLIIPCTFFFQTGDLLFHLRHLLLKLLHGLFKFFDFPSSAQKITWVFKCSTGHGTTWIDQLAFQCYDTDRLVVFPCNYCCMINMIYYQCSSQQIICKGFIFALHLDQFVGCPDNSRFFQYFRPVNPGIRTDRR